MDKADKYKEILDEIEDNIGQLLSEPKDTLYSWREIKEIWDIIGVNQPECKK